MNKVWTYVMSRQLSDHEIYELLRAGAEFVKGWTAHENKLSAHFEIVKKRILVITVNEDIHAASGCSIDKQLRFIKEMEGRFNVELLNRLLVAYKKGDEIEVAHSSQIKKLLSEKILNEETFVYNTSAGNETELRNWEQPLKISWLKKYLAYD
jgi:hypothetical protein